MFRVILTIVIEDDFLIDFRILRNLLDQAFDLLGAGSLRAGAAGLIALLAGYRGYTAARAVKLEILTISWMSFSNFSALSPGVKW